MTSGSDRLTILLVDDHHLVRDGLKLGIRQVDPDSVILEGESVEQAITLLREHPDIDLVLLDLHLPGYTGLQSLEAVYAACPDARVVIISASYDMQTVQTAVKAGVLGFVPKLSNSATLQNALRFILGGGIYVPPEALVHTASMPRMPLAETSALPQAPATAVSPQEMGLTARQVDVLKLLLQGKSNKQICRDLDLALGTVKSHVAAVLQALKANTRAQAVVAVEKMGWRARLMEADSPPT